MNEKYYWTATLSAPQEYPMEVYEGALIADNYTFSFDTIWGTQNTGWGNNGGTMNIADNKENLPKNLSFTYYSIVENKFYQINRRQYGRIN